MLGDGNSVVHSTRYEADNQRLYINDSQYFSNVSKAVWEFEVGNNRVIRQLITDEQDKELSLVDITHFCKVADAIKGTFAIQDEIDRIYPDIIADTIKVDLEKFKLQGLSNIQSRYSI